MSLCSSVPEQNETLLVINISKIIALLHFFHPFSNNFYSCSVYKVQRI